MQFVMERDPMGIVRFRGEYDEMELASLNFSGLDLWMLRTVGETPNMSAADYLLCLETIYRRNIRDVEHLGDPDLKALTDDAFAADEEIMRGLKNV